MTSQGPSLEIVERLAVWSSDEIQNNIHQITEELSSYLAGEDKGHVLQAVYALLVTCLPSVPLETVDECLLQDTMSAAQLLFHESLEGIKLRLFEKSESDFGEVADTLSSLLQVCVELLKCMESVLQYIALQGNVNLSSVASVPKTVASLMLQTFRHCKESEVSYRDVFAAVSGILGTMFRQCHQVQCVFFGVITCNIKFNCSMETEFKCLLEVLQVLSEIGEHVMSLDVKTMAEHWKGYAKLVQMYLEPLRKHLNVAYPVTYLCTEVESTFEQLMNASEISPQDNKVTIRLVKTTSFILKIVVKLCEQFGNGNNCLGDCQSSLYNLLLVLHRSASPILAMRDFDKTLIDEISRHLVIAADPLLSHIICEADFREEFFKRLRKNAGVQKDRLAHLHLLVAVLKRIAMMNQDDKSSWFGEEKKSNIVGCLLELLKSSHGELSSEIWLSAAVKPGEAPRNCDLYEALCYHCAGLILSLNTDLFQKVETILLDSLLEPHFWPALLAGDVWCIIARAGSSELVLEQVLYIAEVISSIEPRSQSILTECKFLSLFLSRLCTFLGSKGRQTLMDKYPPSDHPHLWRNFGLACIPADIRDSVTMALLSNAVKSVEAFLSSNFSVASFNEMVLTLYGLCGVLESSLSNKLSCDNQQFLQLIPKILSLWQFAFSDLPECLQLKDRFVSGTYWLKNLLEILCGCTEHLIQIFSNKEILKILDQFECVLASSLSSIKLFGLRILRSLAHKAFEPTIDQAVVCSKIAKIFSNLLDDSNSLVQETALENFEYFAHFTTHECIVAEAVADSPVIQEIVASYLQRSPPSVHLTQKVLCPQEYYQFQGTVHYTHKCELQKQRTKSPLLFDKPAKKLCLEANKSSDLSDFIADDLLCDFVDKEVTDAVCRICKDVDFLISQSSSFHLLSASVQKDLKTSVQNLSKFLKLGDSFPGN